MISRRDFSKSMLTAGAGLLAASEAVAAAAPASAPNTDPGRPGAPSKGRVTKVRGLIHTPPTPFTPDNRIDTDTFQKLADFMIRHGADAFAHPMHIGEALTLMPDERRFIAKLTVEAVNGRVPVIIHTSATGTDEVVALSQYAQSVGVDAVISTTPYYWHPPAIGVTEHFVKLGSSIDIPFFAYHNEKAGPLPTSILPEIIRRCPNFIGLKEASIGARYLAEATRVTQSLRPEFGVFAGAEYTLYTMPAGGAGCYSPTGYIAPRLVRSLVDACVAGDYKKALPLQLKVSELTTILAEFYTYSSSMAAMEIMGRPCGKPRLPIPTLSVDDMKRLEARLAEGGFLDSEPHGWT
ncbi:MAG: dihydrodipicolinate synthase family protein [Terriglobia bacterium]